jgi:TRAP-type mannitol/chloroaromatic compound transport system permease large subunit
VSAALAAAAGLAMIPAAIAVIVATGLPAFVALIGVAMAFALFGIACGSFDAQLLQAIPARLIGLLEADLLQALALYALIGSLLHHLRVAPAWLATARRVLAPSGAGLELAAIGLGALTAPLNGSVGASLAMLDRSVASAMREAGVAPARVTALVCAGCTLGVIVPPSLVLLLLGDAMMRAHTEALLVNHAAVRVVNNHDVIMAVLLPGAMVLASWLLATWFGAVRAGGSAAAPAASPPLPRGQAVLAAAMTAGVLALLVLIATGRLYAVEGAATGGVALLGYALVSGRLRGRWAEVMGDAMRLTGTVFALLIAATTFTLVLRGFAIDAWLAAMLRALPGGPPAAIALVLGLLLVCAFVLDAFELIFLVVPIVMPPLLAVVDDAAWVAVATLLVLQLGFLLPPLGYAVLMARSAQPVPPALAPLARALLPYQLGLALVLGAVLTWPGLTHFARSAEPTAIHLPQLDVEALMRAAPSRGEAASAPP